MSLFSHPIKKLTLLAAFGGGYVLGAKAGRERYEQLKHTAQQVADDPRVHDVAERVQNAAHVASDTAEQAVDVVTDQGNQEDVRATIQEVADATINTVEDVADAAKDKTAPGDTEVHPLLADEHIESADEIVYTSGPDIEESIDELAAVDATKNPAAEDKQGTA